MPALLVSVGGSPAPILHTLRTHRPTHVGYFCSAGSRVKAEEIQAQLEFNPIADFLEVAAYEDLGPCYAALRAWLPGWLTLYNFAPEDVTVDYTGGTKTMSAALVLAASELFSHFSYIGGTQRDKAGSGIVLSGSEHMHYQGNPWHQLAVRELDQAATLWAAQQYEAVESLLRRTKGRVPLEQRPGFERVIDLSSALSARLSLRLAEASETLAKLDRKLAKISPSLASQDAFENLRAFCRDGSVRLAASHSANGPASDPRAQLRELLDNAILTSRLGRHDDAAARLYRALELHGQNELTRLTAGAFKLGQLKEDRVPASLASFPGFVGPDGELLAKRGIPLEQVYRALSHLGHPAGRQAVAEFDGPDSLKSHWRTATQRRNQSILAHGIRPVGPDGFASLAKLVADFTGENTTQVDLDAPGFNLVWFTH
jgi:CRISPR-associated protein (TIGR02710 family)